MPTYVVCGGGVLGAALTSALLRDGATVLFVDDSLPANVGEGVKESFKLLTLLHAKNADSATKGCSAVFDLSGVRSSGEAASGARSAMTARAYGVQSLHLVGAAQRNGCKKFVHVHSLGATAAPGSAAYLQARGTEATVLEYGADASVFDTRVVRLGCVFGPGLGWRGAEASVVAAACVATLSSSTQSFKASSAARSFVFIDDAVRGCREAMDVVGGGGCDGAASRIATVANGALAPCEIAAAVVTESGRLGLSVIDDGGRGAAACLVPLDASEGTLLAASAAPLRTPLASALSETLDWIRSVYTEESGASGADAGAATADGGGRKGSKGRVTVIGIGRLGLCWALVMERAGYDVLGVDIFPGYVDALNAKSFSTNEPRVNELLDAATRFRATTDMREGVDHAEVLYLLVHTPSTGGHRHYDTQHIAKVLAQLNRYRVRNKHIVIGCTVMPTYCTNVAAALIPDCEGCTISYNPEFIAQGDIIAGQLRPDMVLIGEGSPEAGALLEQVRSSFHFLFLLSSSFFCLLTLFFCFHTLLAQHHRDVVENDPHVCRLTTASAEICKLSINCFCTTKISYANMIGDICDATPGAEKFSTLNAVGLDSRVGLKVSVLLCTVTFYANHAHNLTRSP
jgi:nucleoside-diphosphate-sugar epimerase